MSYPRAIGRAVALAALALVSWLDVLVELIAFCLLCVGLVFFLGPAVEWARHRSGVMRRLAGQWGGIEIPAPYQPEPPEPVRERDGWYRDGNQLYKRAFWIRWQRRLTWALEDPAAQREFSWQLVNPLATLALPIAAVFAGPAALRGYGRWTRWWIGTRPAPGAVGVVRRRFRWIHLRLESLGHLMGIFALSVVLLPFAALPAVLLVLPPVAAPVIVWSRVIANTLRREIGNWTGVRIPGPYLPPPPLPVPRADGLFQVGKQLYEEPWWPVQQARIRWVLRDRATWRDLAASVVNPLVTFALMLVPFVLMFWGFLGLLALWVWRPIAVWTHTSWSTTHWFAMIGLPETSTNWGALALTPVALAAMFAGLYPAKWLARQSGLFSRLLLGPTESSRLAQRVRRLAQTRTDATDAQAAVLRRIERDLHDGIQSRLVAMGMKLGAVEVLIDTDPAAAKQLAAELRSASSEALAELRVLVRGIHPPVLSERGLLDAVRAMALDSPLKAEVTGSLPGQPDEPTAACAYFAVSELLGNAAKHGAAQHVTIEVSFSDGFLRIVVTDDGRGGAEPARGSGLRGIERRLGGFDGTLSLTSPIGGPTTATVELPCQLDPGPSSPKTSTSSGTD